MAEGPNCWEQVILKKQVLDKGFDFDLGRVTSDRIFWQYTGDEEDTRPRYYYLKAIPPRSFIGSWKAGVMVPVKDGNNALNNKNPTARIIFADVCNPIDGATSAPGKKMTIVREDVVFLSGEELKGSLDKLNVKDPPFNVLGVNLQTNIFVRERDKYAPDPDIDHFVGLNPTNCNIFGHKKDDVFVSLDTLEHLMKSPKDYFKGREPTIPGRNAKGAKISLNLGNVMFSRAYKSNSAIYVKMFKDCTGTGSYSPPRSIDPDTTIWLKWKNSGTITYAKFKELVEAVPDAGKTGDTKIRTKYEVFEVNQLPEETKYFKLGSSPFGDYETWIEHSLLAVYLGKRKERPLPTQDEIDAAALLLKDTTKTQSKNQPLDQPSHPTSLAGIRNQVYTKLNANRELVQNDGVAHDHGDVDFSVIATVVSAQGLKTAIDDPRDVYPGQAPVWGGVSTTKIAEKLNWADDPQDTSNDDKWPKPNPLKSEWLHRSAYSWGGIVNGFAGSSQVPENLIFGSRDTNSMMTRYETIWQDLLRSMTSKGATKGRFRTINPENNNVEEISLQSSTYVKRTFTPLTRNINVWQPWLCYQLHCELNIFICPEQYKALRILTQSFWPFQRMFFTRFEASLDRSLLEYYKAVANGRGDAAVTTLAQVVGTGTDSGASGTA